jgi:hypothetical protein
MNSGVESWRWGILEWNPGGGKFWIGILEVGNSGFEFWSGGGILAVESVMHRVVRKVASRQTQRERERERE